MNYDQKKFTPLIHIPNNNEHRSKIYDKPEDAVESYKQQLERMNLENQFNLAQFKLAQSQYDEPEN